jgi:Asp-tRNA(Asn)/Glu-tRNA(Gln) amidotransferase C subunit
MADLTDADVLALAKASGIEIPGDLVSEVRESMNGLLEALEAIEEPDVAGIQPLPIIVSATARKQEAQ